MECISTTTSKKNKFSLQLLIPIVFICILGTFACSQSPKVLWTQQEIVEDIVSGNSIERSVNFTLSGQPSLKYDIRFELSSSLSSFVSVDPESLLSVQPGPTYSTQLTFSFPPDTTPGEYVGNLQILSRLIEPIQGNEEIPALPPLNIKLSLSSPLVNLSVKNTNGYPTRLAQGPNGNIYVTDAAAGSVFIYNPNLILSGEMKNFDQPLGIAVDADGNLFVGNNGRDNIEVYTANGEFKFAIDDGNILMPSDIALDNSGNLYVADSMSHMVKVYTSSGQWLRNIGQPGDNDGELNFPSAIALSHNPDSGVLYVADQGHSKVQLYDLSGNYITSFGQAVSAFSSDWQGRFAKIQSLSFDHLGRLHAADCYLNKIQIFDTAVNSNQDRYIDAYGEFGLSAGQLNLPLDIHITENGQVAVTNAGNHRVELMAMP